MKETFILVMMLFCVSCGSFNIAVSPSESKKATFREGDLMLVSQKQNRVTLMTPSKQSNDSARVSVFVEVFNGARSSFDLSTENITVVADGKARKIYTYDGLKKEVALNAAIMGAATSVQAASDSLSASLPTTSYSSGQFGTYGVPSTSGTYSGITTTYNPAATAAAQTAVNRNLDEKMNQIGATTSSRMVGIQSVMRKTTIPPGQQYGGKIIFQKPSITKPKETTISVTLPSETHTFKLILSN
jgi:hypothetical protein